MIAVTTATATRLWLAGRHTRHLRAHRDSVPAEFAASITPEAHRNAADYTCEKTRIGSVEALVSAAVALAFTLGGGLQAISDFWAAWFAPAGFAHGLALIGSVVLVGTLVELPLDVVRTFGIEARYGFNRTTPALYAADLARQAAIGVALGAPLVLCVLWLMQRTGSAWWLYAWLVWVAFSLTVVAIYPSLIAPLFNRFVPLEDGALRDRIDALLERCGFRSRALFVIDSSRRSNHGNAYFAGFGTTRRIVLYDTLIARLAPQEIEAVLAHELGHFSLHHVWKRMAVSFAGGLAFLALLGALIEAPWFFSGLGVQTPSPAMALVLFSIALPPFAFPLRLVVGVMLRRHEYQADAYAAAHTSGSDMAQALVRLTRDNAATLTPDPLYSAFHDSHPPAALRIGRLRAFAGNPKPGSVS